MVVRTAWSFGQVTNNPVICLMRPCVKQVIDEFVSVASVCVVSGVFAFGDVHLGDVHPQGFVE